MTMNGEKVRTWKRMFMASYNGVSQDLLGVAENTHDNPHSGKSMTWFRFELGITQIKISPNYHYINHQSGSAA
jgi:hypothetical protein